MSGSLEYTHFSDFSQVASAPQYHLSDNPNLGSRYMAAPQLFYFAPKNKWFPVFRQGPPACSATDDPTRPETWSTPTNFFAGDIFRSQTHHRAVDPASDDGRPYSQLPWQLGLLTQTNPAC